jgi:hypothetical protein
MSYEIIVCTIPNRSNFTWGLFYFCMVSEHHSEVLRLFFPFSPGGKILTYFQGITKTGSQHQGVSQSFENWSVDLVRLSRCDLTKAKGFYGYYLL